MDRSAIKTLLVAEEPGLKARLVETLAGGGLDPAKIKNAASRSQALALLERHDFDVALVDLDAVEGGGLDTARALRYTAPDLPLVALAFDGGPDADKPALEAGAQAYLQKDELSPGLLARMIGWAMDRSRTETELRDSQRRQRLILDGLPVGVVMVDPERFVIVDANRAAGEMIGMDKDQVIGLPCRRVMRPADGGPCPAGIPGRDLERSEELLTRVDGSTIPILKTVTAVNLGGRRHFLEAFLDFSDQKKARQALEEMARVLEDEVSRRTAQLELSMEQWEATFNAVPDLVSIISNNDLILKANQSLGRHLGEDPEALVGKCCDQLDPAIARSLGLACQAEVPSDGDACVVLGFGDEEDEGDFLVSTSPLYDTEGQVYARVHVARDVSDIKRAERLAQSRLEFMATVLETIPCAIFIKDRRGVFVDCNSSFAQLLGKPRREIRGRTIFDLVPREKAEFFQARDELLFQSPGAQVYEAKMVDSEKRLREFVYYAATYEHERGGGEGLVCAMLEVTERKRMEAQLLRGQKLEAIGQLAAGIAHEINTPTQYIRANLEFLHDAFGYFEGLGVLLSEVVGRAGEGGIGRDLLAKARDAVDMDDLELMREDVTGALEGTMDGVGRITKIVESMRYFSHPGSDSKGPLDVNRAIEHAVTVSRNEWKYYAELEMDLAGNLPMIMGYSGPLNQVLLNIIINAAQAICEKIGENPSEKGLISIATHDLDGMVRISIGDNGPGIPEEVMPYIFDPFFTTKDIGKGTGQGLALAHSIVVGKHAGQVHVETEPGRGTTFVLTLPVGDMSEPPALEPDGE